MIRIKEILEKYYDLGNLLNTEELFAGYVNRSFVIQVDRNGERLKYLVRKYNPAIEEKEIRFEHALINHLKANGFTIVAGVIPKKDGSTYCKETIHAEGETTVAFWAIFEFLKGEDRYTWMDTSVTPEEMTSASQVLAKLHDAGRDFIKPRDADRAQPKIMNLLPTMPQTYGEYVNRAGNTKCDRLFLENVENISMIIHKTIILESELDRMPQLPVHCDYHQGNLKFEDSRVVGVFDFDWSKVDARLFDPALAMVYFCASWEGDDSGSLRLNECVLFLRNYNEACRASGGLTPLTEIETKYLPTMIAAANLFVLHWDIVDFYTLENPDDDEYMTYINHNIKLMYWIEDNKQLIADMTNQACR